MSSTELLNVQQFFKSHNLELSTVWLKGCVKWCKDELLTLNYTLNDLKMKVYEQWLLLDLRDMHLPSLPENLSLKKQFNLTGTFCLQIMQIKDISEPKLSQYQKIRKRHILIPESEDPYIKAGKRMLHLTLTDGVQTLEAVEYHSIPCININMSIGVKVRLIGPLTLRRGLIMLKEENIQILGGEVEEFVTSTYENLLSMILKLPESIENPLIITRKKTASKDAGIADAAESVICADEELNQIKETDILIERKKDPIFKNTKSKHIKFDKSIKYTNLTNNAIGVSTKLPNVKNENSFQGCDMLNNLNIDNVFSNINKDINKDKNIITNLNSIKKEIGKVNSTDVTFKAKARFKSVVEKLTIKNGIYKLRIKIEDDTSDLIVQVHSDLVSEYLGQKPAAMFGYKSNNLDQNSGFIDEVIITALQKLKEKLISLDNEVEIALRQNEDPTILKIV